ncbi:3126_t:CDS:2, partial [Gigaspora margarita]
MDRFLDIDNNNEPNGPEEYVSWKCPEKNQDSDQQLNNNERQRPEDRSMNSDKNRPTVDESESAFILKNPSNETIIEVYAAKRRKENNGEATEVKTPELSKEESKDHVHKGRKVIAKKTLAPNIRKEITKITRARRIITSKVADFCIKQDKNLKTTSMYCEAQVKGQPILLIINSGSSGCVVSANFLKEVGISIDHPLTVLMIKVHEEQKCPLGEVNEFPVIVEGKTITSRAIVSDAGNYTVIVRNDWLKKKEIEEESTLDEKAGSKSEEEEYKDESLINETYFYIKLRKANDKPKICEICLKVDHNDDLCSLTMKQEVEIKNLLKEYNDVFKEETGQLGRTAIIQHEIIIEGGLPNKQRFYPTSKPEYEFIGAEICQMEEAGI